MHKHSVVSLAIDDEQHVWAINFNGLVLDFSALCKCRLIALHKPFKGSVSPTIPCTCRYLTGLCLSATTKEKQETTRAGHAG